MVLQVPCIQQYWVRIDIWLKGGGVYVVDTGVEEIDVLNDKMLIVI